MNIDCVNINNNQPCFLYQHYCKSGRSSDAVKLLETLLLDQSISFSSASPNSEEAEIYRSQLYSCYDSITEGLIAENKQVELVQFMCYYSSNPLIMKRSEASSSK